ncbi:hypothetical protein IGS68_06170 [Skermanella sp. TT6]|uniref:t-SNARE coiled-coil homology domain-containing protein n=1 Tax=Skermanella cutis TaxID=2775420 RepID=A0ABX7B8V0_9PROT|nr:hypothetical protein [Skermanella sp. TT6]QQP90809.1 hypothetical protein IGS68_06170 [Skermanella sp. TT6]
MPDLEYDGGMTMTGGSFGQVTGSEREVILAAIHELGVRMDRRFEQMDRRFEQVDRRFEQVDRRFEQVDKRLEKIDEHSKQMDRQLDRTDMRVETLETEVSGIKSEMKVLSKGVLALQLSMKHLPSYWHMYVALTGLVVTVYSLMRFAMPSH